MKPPRLSIVIPAYNVAPFIGAAVASALAQTMRDLEVIVVDDGSTDATPAILESFTDPRLRVIQQPNAGLAAARNTGIRAARGRYLGLLDGDDIWMPEKAARQLEMLEHHPRVTLTFSNSAYLHEDGTPTGALLLCSLSAPTWQQMLVRNHVGNGSTPIGRTADFREAGLFDTRLRTALEDYEFWPRLMRRTGRQIRLIPEPLTGYRIRAGSLSASFEGFLKHAELARRLLAEKLPEAPPRLLDLGLAGTYRVAARKAAAMGRRAEALRYLRRALAIAPTLPLHDARFFPTLAIALTGGRGEGGLHRVLRAAMAHRR